MKIKITDGEALGGLSWVDLKAYLDAAQWENRGVFAGKASIYQKEDQGGRLWEILLPTRDDFADYAERMADAVTALANVEGRDEASVFIDLQSSGSDVIRLRSPQSDDYGTIPIVHGVAMYREAENLILSAACAAREPRRTYHPRKMAEVRDYLDRVRLGQTARGSYVFSIYSPVEPTFNKSFQGSLGPYFEGEPFARLVTLKLAESLTAAREAVSRAISEDKFDAFESAVSRGVNANLCEALSELTEQGSGLDISITWARVRPTVGPPVRHHFSRETGRVLREAAVQFRRYEPKLDERIEGFVIALDRPPEQFDGQATLRVLVDGRTRRVSATFEPTDYNLVLEANRERLPVSLDADIYPKGQRWELRNPRNLQVLYDTENEDTL